MAIRGYLEGMAGSYLTGWAAPEPDTGHCSITVINAKGVLVAKGTASQGRADLAMLGLGRTTMGFRIAVALLPEPQLLHVLADGIELPGSPVSTGAGRYDGACALDLNTVTGWVTERVADFAPPAITIRDQHGRLAGEAAAMPDPQAADGQFTPARFTITLADRCFGAGELRLSVFANGVKFWDLACNLKVQGNLETITPEKCAGWLVVPAKQPHALTIEVYRDGVLAGTAQCNIEREDVAALYPDCGKPAFSIELGGPGPAPLQAVTLSLRLPGSDTELFDGPYVLASRPAAVQAAQRAVRLARREALGDDPAQRAVIEAALGDFLANARQGNGFIAIRQARALPVETGKPRLTIVIPIYRDVDVTRACISSVLAHRNPQTDQVVLINDVSPDADMMAMLIYFAKAPNVFLLDNEQNLGFVRSVNRGLEFALGSDVLLLNSDTVMFAGGLDELCRVAYAAPEIGVVTAMSNNATIFSYPHPALQSSSLPDIGWRQLAAAALAGNAGKVIDVPTGHGFCMLIKAEVMRRIGYLDEAFGRGYGEENDFCARAGKFGYRSVAAAGVLVEHRESISFEGEKASLMAQNMPRLNAMYPEYSPVIMEFERQDGLRAARWALDRVRLQNAVAAGAQFVLVITNELEGGTPQAIKDIGQTSGYGGSAALTLRAMKTGVIELLCEEPMLWASFLPAELDELFAMLKIAGPVQVQVHQLLGFPDAFMTGLGNWAATLNTVYYAHDFYPFCQRVTMIDAIGRFCDVADAATCARCVEMDGAHELSKLNTLSPAAHRQMFAGLLGRGQVIAPSANAAGYMRRAFPGLAVQVYPHPENFDGAALQTRAGSDDEIVMIGAIGGHKGSARLLELARRARMTHPHLRFRVIGYTDIDEKLAAVGNVTITGRYKPEELPGLIAKTRGRLALFLFTWPETYSYTLSEAVKHGFIPLVPDIGAPAERVRAAGYGAVFGFPADPVQILQLIDEIAAGRRPECASAGPQAFYPPRAPAAEIPAPAKARRKSPAPAK